MVRNQMLYKQYMTIIYLSSFILIKDKKSFQAFRRSGVQALRRSGVQAFRCPGAQTLRRSDAQALRRSGAQALRCQVLND